MNWKLRPWLLKSCALAAVLALVCGCGNGKMADSCDDTTATADNDSLRTAAADNDSLREAAAMDWDADDRPMPMYELRYFDENYNLTGRKLRHLFDYKEDVKDYYLQRAKTYTTMLYGSRKMKIAYKGEHKGPEVGNMIWNEYKDCMSGLDYECKGDWTEGFAFTDHFMQSHEMVPVKEVDRKAPKDVVESLQTRYGTKVDALRQIAATDDGRLKVYWGQMAPQGNRCLGLGVVQIGDRLLVDECWTDQYYEETGYYSWNVDDEGEYLPISVVAVTKGSRGYDLFYRRGTPEGFAHGVLLVRGDKVVNHCFCNFYVYVDYVPE